MDTPIYFITSNPWKFEEAQKIVPQLELCQLELAEIQSLNTREILEAKLREAFRYKEGHFVVEDTSLFFEGLHGLPGPLIKWFLKSLSLEEIASLVLQTKNVHVKAQVMLGYALSAQEMYFFEGTIDGSVVMPRGNNNMAWDPIFEPLGHAKTFAEMSLEEKNSISHRRIAFEKFREFLQTYIP